MDTLMGLIHDYGYYMVFLGTLLEGETIVALAGFAAHQSYLDLETVIVVAIVGATLGDHIFFLVGRKKGRAMIARRPKWQPQVARIHAWLDRYQNWLIFGSRFLYGFRAITPIVLGTSNVSWVRYFVLNVAGAITWACLFALGGYWFGDAIERFLGNVKAIEGTIIAVVLCVGVGAHVVGRRLAKRDEEEGSI
jgi:membrane protein DedA with SNARE-associated domain